MKSKQEKQLNNVDTVVGVGSALKGDVESDASIRVDGRITGTVNCKGDVVIGKDGQVDAEVKGRNVTIAGTVNGNVVSEQMLKIEVTGKLKGDAKMATLVIDEGGQFDGKSTMGSTSDKAEEQKDNHKDKKNKKNNKAS